jgi:hypothetical protein
MGNTDLRETLLKLIKRMLKLAGVFMTYSLAFLGLLHFIMALLNIHSFFPFETEHGHYWESLAHKVLNSFEFFFMAPIPILVIGTINRYASLLIGEEKNSIDHENSLEISAKKTFISSIIGICITSFLEFILGNFEEGLTATQQQYIFSGIMMGFIILLCLYYKMLSGMLHEPSGSKLMIDK